MQLAADAGQKHDAAAFISTTYKILDAGYEEIAWNADGKSFVIRNPERFAERILLCELGSFQEIGLYELSGDEGAIDIGRRV